MNEKTFRHLTPGVKNDIVSPKNTRLQKICQHLNFFTGKKRRRDVIPAGAFANHAAIPGPSPIFRLKNKQEKRMVTRINIMLTQEQDLPIIR
jgi:hypothetical protein